MPRWPFPDAPNVAVFTSRAILDGKDWIHYVTHDEEDGAWQFHPYAGPTSEADAVVIALETIVKLDSTVTILADLPTGWHAWREGRDLPWEREAKAR